MTNALQEQAARRKRFARWSDAKLEKELAFARGFADDDVEAVAEMIWLVALEAEAARRGIR